MILFQIISLLPYRMISVLRYVLEFIIILTSLDFEHLKKNFLFDKNDKNTAK